MNSAATMQNVGRARATRSPAKHVLNVFVVTDEIMLPQKKGHPLIWNAFLINSDEMYNFFILFKKFVQT
jgi:hypothetical protein